MNDVKVAQIYFLGILFARPQYYPKISVSIDMFDEPYKTIAKACFESCEKYKHISPDYLMTVLQPELQMEFYRICSKPPTTVFSYFVEQERLIYERNIEKTLDVNIQKFKNGELDLQQLKSLLELPSAYDGSYLNYDDLKTTLVTEQRNLIFSGYRKLRSMATLKETDFLVLAAYTGKGKSALALNLLEDLSRNYECTYFNLEMGIASVHKRMISIHSGILMKELDGFKFADKNTQEKILKYAEFIKNRKITLINESQTIDSIRDVISSKNNAHQVVFIDHIGLVKAPGSSLYERMTHVAKELRKMSLDYNATIIGLCQLNRQGAKGKPDLSMLRDSGEVEQSASKIWLMYSEETENGERYHLDIAKNRDGMTGTVNIIYNKASQQISEE